MGCADVNNILFTKSRPVGLLLAMPDESVSPPVTPPAQTPPQPPNIGEPLKWFGYHLTKDWHLMTKAPIAFLAVLLLSLLLARLYIWDSVIPEKDEQLKTKQSQIDFLTKKLEASDKDTDRLRAENAAYRAGHDDKSLPLKKRVLILSDQLEEYKSRFTDAWTKRDTTRMATLSYEWENRFKNRVDVAESQLDDNGQHSEKLERIGYIDFYNSDPTAAVELIASELKRMAEALPDNP